MLCSQEGALGQKGNALDLPTLYLTSMFIAGGSTTITHPEDY